MDFKRLNQPRKSACSFQGYLKLELLNFHKFVVLAVNFQIFMTWSQSKRHFDFIESVFISVIRVYKSVWLAHFWVIASEVSFLCLNEFFRQWATQLLLFYLNI